MPTQINAGKAAHAEAINRCLDQYERLLFVNLNNVTSQQMHKVRRDIVDGNLGEFMVGKKTTQKKILDIRANRKGATAADRKMWEIFVRDNLLTGNLALCFTDRPVGDLVKVFETYRVQAPARVGAISPVEVIVPAGNTGFEPNSTSFFQALNISTKIAKGTVEIINDKKVLSPGDKVDSSTAALLAKLNISPFFYNPEVTMVWEKGALFTLEDLAITDKAIEDAFLGGVANLTGLSLGSGVATELSLPHAIADGFKNLLAAAVGSNYSFPEYNGAKLIADCKAGRGGGGGGAGGGAAAAAAPAEKAPEKAPEKGGKGGKDKAPEKAPEPAPADDGEDADLLGGLW